MTAAMVVATWWMLELVRLRFTAGTFRCMVTVYQLYYCPQLALH